jgi:hypothetical protein
MTSVEWFQGSRRELKFVKFSRNQFWFFFPPNVRPGFGSNFLIQGAVSVLVSISKTSIWTMKKKKLELLFQKKLLQRF